MHAIADPHLALVRGDVPQTPEGCTACLRLGPLRVHLRLCLPRGHLGWRDSSPLRHAHVAAHPIVRAFEPGKSRR
jgi:monovalent cation/hydrogen antiporter